MKSQEAFEHEYLLYLLEVKFMLYRHACRQLSKKESGKYLSSQTADAWEIWQRATKWADR